MMNRSVSFYMNKFAVNIAEIFIYQNLQFIDEHIFE